MICLLRWELEGDEPFLFNHPNNIMRGISQDSWMWYSQESPLTIPETKVLMGKPGCDNRIAFVLRNYLKYDLLNCPFLIKSYHNHKSGIRYYSRADKIQGPYNYIQPIL